METLEVEFSKETQEICGRSNLWRIASNVEKPAAPSPSTNPPEKEREE